MAEKSESLIFLVVGIVAIGFAFFCYLSLKTNFYKGLAVPLLIIGIIQATVGYMVYARSDEQRISNVYAYDMNRDKLKTEELPRMRDVYKRFSLYRWSEIVLLAAGMALILLYRMDKTGSFWLGLGISLAIQALFMLAADYFAEKRAGKYKERLEVFTADKRPPD